MRFKSSKVDGFRIFAVSGVNTVSFGIDFDAAKLLGLLGFAVEREDLVEKQRYYMYGFKVFKSIYPHPDKSLKVTTFDHPVQSFVWDDFTAKEGRDYVYYFHPLRGTPKNLDRSANPIEIKVRTEDLYTSGTHDVFFNRGVASSQAYAREFNNTAPDKLPEAECLRARKWLGRHLEEALFRFIDQAKKGDTLLGAFYEFRYLPAAEKFKQAIDRGVEVKLVLDAKKNGRVDKNGKIIPDFPREDNLGTVKDAKLPKSAIACWREKNRNEIAHNKFMVLLKGGAKPTEVWTGSTNLSDGGIHGQTNVGHWVRDPDVAASFRDYWTLLQTDPGKPGTGSRTDEMAAMASLRSDVEAIDPSPSPTDWKKIVNGTTPVFSPRSGSDVLDMYSDLLDQTDDLGCITLAFGISKVFKDRLIKHTKTSPLTFLMLEKKDEPTKPRKGTKPKPFVELGWKQNVYAAWGSYINDPLYQWTRETNANRLKLNHHVNYVHSKFLLHNPLGDDPVVVTGSANFSDASTNANDENMLLIRGEARVADIYFTEFNRIFFHYYFRSVHEEYEQRQAAEKTGAAVGSEEPTLFLSETDDWLKKYKPQSLKTKRVKMFTTMAGAEDG